MRKATSESGQLKMILHIDGVCGSSVMHFYHIPEALHAPLKEADDDRSKKKHTYVIHSLLYMHVLLLLLILL
jgi:hypothetical protein